MEKIEKEKYGENREGEKEIYSWQKVAAKGAPHLKNLVAQWKKKS